VSLKQWSHFTREDRGRLLTLLCDTLENVRSYRQCVVTMIEARTTDKAKDIAVERCPEWDDGTRIPDQLNAYGVALGLLPLSLPQWAGLTPLQRYALLKLSRSGHDNDNFLPALREFDLLKH
jgi:hypothetical protein